jgi:glyoxylase-like metal-dependent hydrolase (beta-lactamase superfamily II)
MIQERGNEDWASELGRFPRLFQAAESVPGLTWPSVTFNGKMTVYLGKRRVELLQLGRAHTAGDIVAWVPDAGVMFTGDIVEYHSACYCGDAHFTDWPGTLDAIARYNPKSIAPGRGDALVGAEQVKAALDATKDFVTSTYNAVAEAAAKGGSLKDAMAACRAACDHKFGNYAIYEHCLPFNVARAYDEALGIDTPRIWTAERDREMWAALQG